MASVHNSDIIAAVLLNECEYDKLIRNHNEMISYVSTLIIS
jgi:hypothetical protein